MVEFYINTNADGTKSSSIEWTFWMPSSRVWTDPKSDWFIAQDQKKPNEFELWQYCGAKNNGDRWFKRYKCKATFESLEAAKTAFHVMVSAGVIDGH